LAIKLAFSAEARRDLKSIQDYIADEYVRAANYLIFYRHENAQIFVDRIIHNKRNYIAILFPAPDNA
jgi:plasmid stabilization system protein ParE